MLARALRALRGHTTAPAAEAAERAAAQRQRLRALASDVSHLTERIERLERGLEQLRALRSADDDARVPALLGRLDAERAARHVQQAAAGAVWRTDPSPQLVITGVWPDDLFDALIATMPEAVFFQRGRDDVDVLALPPRLVPVPALVVLTLAIDLVGEVLGPLIAARFDRDIPDASSLRAAPGRLVRRPSAAGAAPDHRAGHVLTTVIDLDGAAANTAVTTRSMPGAPVPAGPHARVSWEFAHYPIAADRPDQA